MTSPEPAPEPVQEPPERQTPKAEEQSAEVASPTDHTSNAVAESAVDSGIDGEAISLRTREAYEKVPEIGTGWRWYDVPYRLLWWLASGWRRKTMPRRAREALNFGINYLTPFNEHDRNKVLDSNDLLFDFTVEADEHVVQSTIWAVEFFPPSRLDALRHAVENNAWDKSRRLFQTGESNAEMLDSSRAGEGYAWWTLAEIQDMSGTYFLPDGFREKLPERFERITLTVLQLSSGLTALVATFKLSEPHSLALDDAWHRPHEPRLVRGGPRPVAEDRAFAAYRSVQTARRAAHDSARSWLAKRCPGFFATANRPQTLIDLLLVEKFDPTSDRRATRNERGSLRALGLTEFGIYDYTSPEIPGMVLSPTRLTMTPALETDRTWALWGQGSKVVEGASDLEMYGDSGASYAIAHRYGDGMKRFVVELAVSDMMRDLESVYAEVRDTAHVQHGRFKIKVVRRLRQQFLTLSLDLRSLRRDLSAYWATTSRFQRVSEFEIALSPSQRAWDVSEGRTPDEPINMNRSLRERQGEWARQLVEADEDYREILSTVASLGASADAYKVGRWALVVAIASLVVAFATIVVSNVGKESIIKYIFQWIASQLA